MQFARNRLSAMARQTSNRLKKLSFIRLLHRMKMAIVALALLAAVGAEMLQKL